MLQNYIHIYINIIFQLSCGSEKLQIILDSSSPKGNIHDDKRSPTLASDRNLAYLSERMYSRLLHSDPFRKMNLDNHCLFNANILT